MPYYFSTVSLARVMPSHILNLSMNDTDVLFRLHEQRLDAATGRVYSLEDREAIAAAEAKRRAAIEAGEEEEEEEEDAGAEDGEEEGEEIGGKYRKALKALLNTALPKKLPMSLVRRAQVGRMLPATAALQLLSHLALLLPHDIPSLSFFRYSSFSAFLAVSG